jgi:histidine triad (HIT) family protein
MAAYDQDNIFAKIIRGEMPCTKVYEDDVALAFMDIMPRTDGHVLVIPKSAARNILDIAPSDLAALMPVVQKIAKAAKRGMNADGVTLQQFSEPAGGQVVFHIHFHVLPRRDGVPLRPHTGAIEKSEILEEHAARIRAALADVR